MAYLDLTCRALLGFVMALAVIAKLSSAENWRDFEQSLSSFTWMPRRLRPAVAVAVVVAELAVALLLVPAPTVSAGAILGALLLIAVTTALIVARVAGKDVRCACFGADSRPIGAWHVVRNLVLVLVAVVVVVTAQQASAQAAPAVLAGLAVGVGAMCAVTLTYPGELAFLIATDRTGPRRTG